MTAPNHLLRRDDASTYLRERWSIKRTPKTLAKLAVVGGGPKFRKDGIRPLYAPADLDEWAQNRLSPLVGSTAELAALKRQAAA